MKFSPRQCLTVLFLFLLVFAIACASKKAKEDEGLAEQVVTPVEMEKEKTIEEGELAESDLEGKKWQEPSELMDAEIAAYFKDIYFDFDDFSLKPRAKDTLRNLAEWLLKNPSTYILVEGHCDERGTNEYNLALGERRANSAKKYLVQLGVSSRRVSTISYGEEKPIDPGSSEGAWEKNRRAHFLKR
jgi:peptidoglycan-associated lipoprotein